MRYRKSSRNLVGYTAGVAKIGEGKAVLYLRALMKIRAFFFNIYFSPGFDQIPSSWHPQKLSDCEFRENRRHENHAWHKGVNGFISLSPLIYWPILLKFGTRDLHKCWMSPKSRQGRAHFSYGRKWNHTYAGTVKPYDTLKAKNAVVKSMCTASRNTTFPILLLLHTFVRVALLHCAAHSTVLFLNSRRHAKCS